MNELLGGKFAGKKKNTFFWAENKKNFGVVESSGIFEYAFLIEK